MTGTAAPTAKARNEPTAALIGDPSSSGSRPSSSRTSVSRAVFGSAKIRWAMRARLVRGEALGPVGGGQLGLLLLGHRLHLGPLEGDLALEQLALALHRDVLAGGHAEGAGQQSGDAREQDEARVVGRGAGHAHHQRQVADEAVGDAEDDRPERAGLPPVRCQRSRAPISRGGRRGPGARRRRRVTGR